MTHILIEKKDVMDLREMIASFGDHKKNEFLHQNDMLLRFLDYCRETGRDDEFRTNSSIRKLIDGVQEFFFVNNLAVFKYRHSVTQFSFYRMGLVSFYMEEIEIENYLDYIDLFFGGKGNHPGYPRLDYLPFYDFSPTIRDSRNIGNGIQFLNRYLSSKLFNYPEQWNELLYNFLKIPQKGGKFSLINEKKIGDFNQLFQALKNVRKALEQIPGDQPVNGIKKILRSQGLGKGWGKEAHYIRENIRILLDLINAPDDKTLEDFISRVPMPLISDIAIISPHGWFGQENVLGLPDTGGQVIYILDQVRALERNLKKSIKCSGLDIKPKIVVLTRLIPNSGNTTCHVRREKILNTENCWILRVPFMEDDFTIVKDWISRFRVWPYLEQFAEDSFTALSSEFNGNPDLIVGNYSDGNLVASLLSSRFNVIQCTIAHALEKNKYPGSDIHWKSYEEKYNFSLQFIADIIAMNRSDFIITSTFQEIAGTDESQGQYESYLHFSLPGLFQVKNGIDLHAPKFNIIPPGVDEEHYFPYFEIKRRVNAIRKKWEGRLFTDSSAEIRGELTDPGKPPVFSMARLDKVKNLSGLVEAFGRSEVLREHYNLIIAAGTTRMEDSRDKEEQQEIRKINDLMEKYPLSGHFRWLPSIEKSETGEVYRIMADRRGIFVQPALFEAFGLTILESMISGLPTFGPKFGGPSEIIQYGRNGYLLNTSSPDLMAHSLEKYLAAQLEDESLWERISANGIRRAHEDFNWDGYSRRLLDLTKLYGFWRFSESEKGKLEMDRYTELIYYFLFKQRAGKLTPDQATSESSVP